MRQYGSEESTTSVRASLLLNSQLVEFLCESQICAMLNAAMPQCRNAAMKVCVNISDLTDRPPSS
jgi:hypothetical protein